LGWDGSLWRLRADRGFKGKWETPSKKKAAEKRKLREKEREAFGVWVRE